MERLSPAGVSHFLQALTGAVRRHNGRVRACWMDLPCACFTCPLCLDNVNLDPCCSWHVHDSSRLDHQNRTPLPGRSWRRRSLSLVNGHLDRRPIRRLQMPSDTLPCMHADRETAVCMSPVGWSRDYEYLARRPDPRLMIHVFSSI